jgi:uncharacterized protein YjgD (DUF1641 family)
MATVTPLIEREDAVEVMDVLERIEAKLDRQAEVIQKLGRRVEEIEELKDDLLPIANGAMAMATRELARLEQAGTIAFLKEALFVAERVTGEFTPEDVHALGENVVSILKVVKSFTQPDMLDVADRAAQALREDPEEAEGMFWLLKQLKDPETRRGLGLTLGVLRQLGGKNGHTEAETADA